MLWRGPEKLLANCRIYILMQLLLWRGEYTEVARSRPHWVERLAQNKQVNLQGHKKFPLLGK